MTARRRRPTSRLLRPSGRSWQLDALVAMPGKPRKQGSIKVQARFRNLDDTRFDEFCGRVVTVVGTYTRGDGETIIRALTSVRP
jgi:hypothetical protein